MGKKGFALKDNLYALVPPNRPGSVEVIPALADLIVQPTGLRTKDPTTGKLVADEELQRLYRELMHEGLKAIKSVPGVSAILYTLVERSMYSFVSMKQMERDGEDRDAKHYARYRDLMAIHQKTASTTASQMQKIISDQESLSYIFVSKVMETVKATLDEVGIDAAAAARVNDSVRESLITAVKEST